MAADDGELSSREKEFLLRESDDALDRARLIADLAVGAFFAADSDKARKAERIRRLDAVTAWLHNADDGPPPSELIAMQDSLHATVKPFHWMLEFPEVFYAERPDPLEGDQVNRAAYMDAFVGNPPFMPSSVIYKFAGPMYTPWLVTRYHDVDGRSDYCAHFFRRANELLGSHGTIGFVATNTISQGDTRDTALKPLIAEGLIVYEAIRSMPWVTRTAARSWSCWAPASAPSRSSRTRCPSAARRSRGTCAC